jgi:hypothetical protein
MMKVVLLSMMLGGGLPPGGLRAAPPVPVPVPALPASQSSITWIDVPASLIETFQNHGVFTLMLATDPCLSDTDQQIHNLLGVDEHAAWLMKSILMDSLYAWGRHSTCRHSKDEHFTWELKWHPGEQAKMLAAVHARAEAFLTPEQRTLFEALCIIEMRHAYTATAMLLHEDESGGLSVTLKDHGPSLGMGSPKENPYCLLVELTGIAKKDVRSDVDDPPPPLEPQESLLKPGSTVKMSVAMAQKYDWSWGFVSDDFSLSQTAKAHLTAEQAKALVTGINQFMTDARAYEMRVARHEVNADGSTTITVEPGADAASQVDIRTMEELMQKTLGKDTVMYHLLNKSITSELLKYFPFLTGESKRITYSVKKGVITFKRKLGKESHGSESNYIPSDQKHLVKEVPPGK